MMHVYSECPGLGTAVCITVGDAIIFGIMGIRIAQALDLPSNAIPGIGLACASLGIDEGIAVIGVAQNRIGKQK